VRPLNRGLLRARVFAEQQGVADRTTIVACAAEQLPFSRDSFAVASAVALLEHLDDDTVAVRELPRVMWPGGLV
jgi:ubiquinone/menaquinone biosynthesis C-methylase UbiE